MIINPIDSNGTYVLDINGTKLRLKVGKKLNTKYRMVKDTDSSFDRYQLIDLTGKVILSINPSFDGYDLDITSEEE